MPIRNPEYAVPYEQAVAMLAISDDGKGAHVHTFRNPAGALIGADWALDKVLAYIQANGVEESGPGAQRLGHGLVSVDAHGGVLYIETKGDTRPEPDR